MGQDARRAIGRETLAAAVLAGLLVVLVPGVAHAAADPYRPQQWHLERIGAPTTWDITRGGGEIVAVVDSGVDLEHPDLVDRFLRRADGQVVGRDFVDGDSVPDDRHGHGTMVAGVAVASFDNGVGGVGVAPGARLMPVRVLDEDGRGTQSDVEDGIRWAVDHGATVVNLSLESALDAAGALPLGLTAPVDAVRYAWERGVVVVAAAGNSGSPFTDYPRSSPVVLVGATDRDDRRASFSDTGRDDILMAPGVDIVSTWCRRDGDSRCNGGAHTYGQADGTSFAAPQVAAAVAMVRSRGVDGATAVDRVRDTARDLGREGPDDETGVGLLDVAAATSSARAAGSTTPGPGSPSPTRTSSHPSPTPTPTSPSATAPPSPTSTPTTTPAPSPTPTETAAPSPTGQPTAERTDGGDTATPGPDQVDLVTVVPGDDTQPLASDRAPRSRPLWALVALALTVGTAIAVGRAMLEES